VYADELSERGIQRGVQARHTYVKVFGNDGPDLRFSATVPGSDDPPAIMGDVVRGPAANFTARVLGAGPGAARPGSYQLFVLKDGLPLLAVPITSDDFSFPFGSVGAGRYRLQVQRESAIEAVSSPIWLDATGYPRPRGATPLRAALVPAFAPCEAPNRTHGAPLAFGSCAPPAARSQGLTVGAPDANGHPAQAIAMMRLDVRTGDPATVADEADVAISATATDVRRRDTLGDFAGELRARVTVRATDGWNGPDAGGGSDAATVTDFPLEAPLPCAPTAAPEGATCTTQTTIDALAPGAVREGVRAIWELGPAEVLDPDGRPFLAQGLFVP
jgi:hypothetical protein